MSNLPDNSNINKIAIIGMAIRFPGAANVDKFWQNLCNGVESISFFSNKELDHSIDQNLIKNPNYIRAKGIIDDAEMFDARFFGMNAGEAEIMGPQQRIFLELAWHAIENAGYNPDLFDGLIGVYAGMGNNTYYTNNVLTRPDLIRNMGGFQTTIANEKDYIATRVSYKMNLKGPGVSINTACSTSLVAVSHACDSLLNYQCDMALAGAVTITSPLKKGYLYEEINILSKDGHCRPFDADATGTVASDGAGIVVLKRLEDALADHDSIYAVIKGTAVNNDGSDKISFMAPSVNGQAEAIAMAIANADLTAENISYIETHGTGTHIGDPIEIEALIQVFRNYTSKKQFCAIGSVKSNIGHLDTASGIASLIKTALALKHKKIPPTIHYKTPNPEIDFENSPFFVNNKLSEWKNDKQPRLAGVSSFGIGGTNAHVILEEAPLLDPSGSSRPCHLILSSAKTESALGETVLNIKKHFKDNPDINIADYSYTLQTGRKTFKYRSMFVCENVNDAVLILETPDRRLLKTNRSELNNPEIVFMFPGQGTHYVNMGQNLYDHEHIFKQTVTKCAEILEPIIGIDIRNIIYPKIKTQETSAELCKTCYNQPALFIMQYALAKVWNSWGINPSAMIGHSIGEYVAACLAGVFSLRDALTLVAARGKLMQEVSKGSMLSIKISEKDLLSILPEKLSLAALNAPSLCVVSGQDNLIKEFNQKLVAENIFCKILETSHAFHSQMMESVIKPFKAEVKKISMLPPKIPFVSTATGTWITQQQATDPAYWANHLRKPVLFSKGIQTLLEKKYIFLEVGPRTTTTTLTKQHSCNSRKITAIPSLCDTADNQSEYITMINALGQLWLKGTKIDWNGFYENEIRRRIPVPGYPFEKKRFWIEPAALKNFTSKVSNFSSERKQCSKINKDDSQLNKKQKNIFSHLKSNTVSSETQTEIVLSKIWRRMLPDIDQLSVNDTFTDLGGSSLLAVQLFAEIEENTGVDLPLSTLLNAPTIKEMAIVLEKYETDKLKKLQKQDAPVFRTESFRDHANLWPCIVPIQPKGDKTPFFCVHGIGGNVLNYSPFASCFGMDQPLYGLQAQGLNGIIEPCTDVKVMAANYIKGILNVQPNGPFFIGGGSLGGLIAFEMAQQLKESGKAVQFLAMFDTYCPKHIETAQKDQSIFYKLKVNKIINYTKKLSGISFVRQVSYIKKSVFFHVDRLIKLALCSMYRKMLKPLPHSLRYWYMEEKHMEAALNYHVKSYQGKIIFFRASSDENNNNYAQTDGWNGIAAEEVSVIEIPDCNHENIIEHSLFKKQLSASLFEAQKEFNLEN